jgi:hypothetical protein
VCTPKGSSGASSDDEDFAQQAPFAERAHDDDPQVQLGGQRENILLDVTLPRIVGNLNRRDPAALHRLAQLGERGRLVVCRADGGDASLVFQLFQHRQILPPVDEIVHLVEVHESADVLQGARGLAASLVRRRRPHFRGDLGGLAAPAQRKSEDALGLAVHRRRIEEAGTRIERAIDDGSRVGLPAVP